MRFDRAAGGLVELRERQCGAQFEAAGLLLLRDGDGGEEGGFGGGGVGGVLFEEDFAANAVESGVEPMLSGLARQRQRFIDPGQGGFRVSPLGFDFREQPLIERQPQLVAFTGVFGQRLSKLGRAGVPTAELRARPDRLQRAKGQPEPKTVLPTERDQGLRGAPSRFSVVTEDFEQALSVIRVDERRDMSGFDCARDRLAYELPRARGVAQAPSRGSQISRRCDCQSPDRGGTWLRGLARGRRFAASVRNALSPARNRLGRGESIPIGDARRPPPSVAPRVPLRARSSRPFSGPTQARREKNYAPNDRNKRRTTPRHRLSPSRALQRARRRLSFPRPRSPWTT